MSHPEPDRREHAPHLPTEGGDGDVTSRARAAGARAARISRARGPHARAGPSRHARHRPPDSDRGPRGVRDPHPSLPERPAVRLSAAGRPVKPSVS
jgi:hypothetical protein